MITCTSIAFGDQLGAQMNTYAELYYIAKENKQTLVLFDNLKTFKRGYQFLDVFEEKSFKIVSINNIFIKFVFNIYNNFFSYKGNWKNKFKRIYKNKLVLFLDRLLYKLFDIANHKFTKLTDLISGVHCDSKLLSLDTHCNYDIKSGFGTYQDWKKYSDEIIDIFSFKEEIKISALKKFSTILQKKFDINKNGGGYENADIWFKNNDTVSIHFRRTDYLLISSLNLDEDYYVKSLKYFDNNCKYIIFSDNIDEVKKFDFLKRIDCIFVENTTAGEDMYLMSRCKNNIIANSTFSFWGAFLNLNSSKKVVCPKNFIGKSAPEVMYINGNYYPETWISLDNLI